MSLENDASSAPVFHYSETKEIPCLTIEDKKVLSKVMKAVKTKKLLLKTTALRPVNQDPSTNYFHLLLDPDVFVSVENCTKLLNDALEESSHVSEGQFTTKTVQLTYENLSLHEAMTRLLEPHGLHLVTSYEHVGHIVHLNLPEAHLPYKYAIGRIFLDKLKAVKTVVNKLGNIDSVFREFKMEVLAGKEDFFVRLKEHGLSFQFDYSKVYWNSRLSTEHRRVLKYFHKGEVICDMFAGVGPFAMPAASKQFQVHANDLNPNSYKYLCENARINRFEKFIHAYNMDGREFVRKLVETGTHFDHVLMNLPASAVEFLDVFRGLFPSDWGKLPTIHCYTFEFFAEDATEGGRKAQASCEKILGGKIEPTEIHDVRDVAPNKHMYCVSFPLPADIGISKKRKLEDATSNETSKRLCAREDES